MSRSAKATVITDAMRLLILYMMHRLVCVLSRLEPDTRRKRLRHHQVSLDKFDRQRRQTARRRAVPHFRSVFGIEHRGMTGTGEIMIVRYTMLRLTTCM